MQRIIILGSTGSIGTTALEVVQDFPDRFQIVGLAARANTDLLESQIRRFAPRFACVRDSEAARRAASGLFDALGSGGELLSGEGGLVQLVELCEADVLLVATVGFAGLFPTLAGIERGMRIALANKEVLVVGGEIVMERARKAGVEVVPIDSEHNAILQCLAGNQRRSVRRLLLTASGGPLRDVAMADIDSVTPECALSHPTWTMGPKITIDSATLMNKGLEVIEACHLFGIEAERVEVVVHPQSAVHSMVEFRDGSILAQMGQTNMYLPILNALAYPERLANKFEPLDLVALGKLEFERPDRERFPCLDYAYEAIAAGGAMPAVLNGANEVAVQAFLGGQIRFGGIARTIRAVMDRYRSERGSQSASGRDLNTLREADSLARQWAIEYAGLPS